MRSLRATLLVIIVGCGSGSATRATGPHARPPEAPGSLDPVADLETLEHRLATMPVVGGIAVHQYEPLYATAAAARASNPIARTGADLVGYRVVADDGDVIELETVVGGDCLEPGLDGWDLHVFVSRRALVPRLTVAVQRRFDDDTVAALEPGAPIDLTGGRIVPIGLLANGPLLPIELGQIALSAEPAAAPISLGKEPGPRLLCRDQREPMTLDEAAQALPSSRDVATIEYERANPPWCGLAPPIHDFLDDDGIVDPAPPTVNAIRIDWPSDADIAVYRTATRPMADIRQACTAVRVIADPGGIGRGGGRGRGASGRAVVVRPGPVTWADGTDAGRSTENQFVSPDKLRPTESRVCFTVSPVQDEVCFDASLVDR